MTVNISPAQLTLDDIERLPNPDLTAREFTPEEIAGQAYYDQLSPAQQRQLAAEVEDWTSGMYRTRSSNTKAREQGRGADLPCMKKIRKAWLEPVTELITKEREIRARSRGRRPVWLSACEALSAEDLAFISLEAIVNCITTVRYSSDPSDQMVDGTTLQMVARTVGHTVEWTLKMRAWAEINPGLLRAIRNRLSQSGATSRHAKTTLNHAYNNKLIPALDDEAREGLPVRWSADYRTQVGGGLVLLIEAATGGHVRRIDHPADIAGKKRASQKAHRPRKLVVFSDSMLAWFGDALRHAELNDRRLRPMVCKPLPWKQAVGGGYLLGNGRVGSIVQDFNSSSRLVMQRLKDNPEAAQPVYNALNYLGDTAWRIRRDVLDLALEAREAGLPLPDLPLFGRRVAHPAKPADIATNEAARKAYRRARAVAEEANIKARSRELSSEMALAEAATLSDEPELYFPHRCDFRGRMYVSAQGVHVQGSDLRRALLEFAHGKPITRADSSLGYLAAHVAGVFGQDKLSTQERQEWTCDNEALLRRIAHDPLGNREEWEATADSKKLWQAYAAAREWVAYLEHGDGFVSHLPLFVDGTCNGLQHFAALARCPELAAAINLMPSDKPQDIYAVVAERALGRVRKIAIDEPSSTRGSAARRWLKLLEGTAPRKLAKRMVMVHPYGGTLDAVRQDMHSQLAALDPHNEAFAREERSYATTMMATELRGALLDQLAKPEALLKWLRTCVECVDRWGRKPGIRWRAPSGWPWAMKYTENKLHQLNVAAAGLQQKISQVGASTQINRRKQKTAASPNFVHSLDAAAMVFALNILKAGGRVTGVAAIHDSIGALAADMPDVYDAVREGFVHVYEDHDPVSSFHNAVLEQVRESERHLVPSPPEPGDFDIHEVLSSPYFFS